MEPLGQSQVFQYLKYLASQEFEITLITFEKKKDWQDEQRRRQVENDTAQARIRWIPLRYHKAPTLLATMFDVLSGTVVAARLFFPKRFQIVHARSYMPALIALICKKAFRTRFIFDMRGFWPDEKADAGVWSRSGYLYRSVKRLERTLLTQADVIVSLTHNAVATMREFPYIKSLQPRPRFEVISTCANLEVFINGDSGRSQTSHPLTLGYLGTARRWYDFPPVLRAFARIKKRVPDARLLVLNRDEHDYILEEVRKVPEIAEAVSIEAANRSMVAQKLKGLDAGIFFLRPLYSVQSAAPTRLAEFLGCGVPCLCNDGKGDMTQIVSEEKVGIVIPSLDDESIDAGVDRLLALVREEDIKERCRLAAEKHFSLEAGVCAYRNIYKSLTTGPGSAH